MWNGVVLAEAPRTVRVEGNEYFPPESVRREYFTDSPTKTVCPWKGLARYYTVEVDGATNINAAWHYPKPSPLARRIKGHVAFWNGVEIDGEPERPLPIWRIGMTSGAFGLLCCVGPTVLALFGILSGATAVAWADDLYDHYAWWFRLGGLTMLAGLTWFALRRRNQCNIGGVRRWRWRLLATVGIAVATYVALYVLTTWLGSFADAHR
jgi:uncharacterized protein (DUF427 family)